MARPSEPVHYFFRFHLHGRPKEEWRELQFKWKLTLDAAKSKVASMIHTRYGQYDTIVGYILKPGATDWKEFGQVWWFPAHNKA